MNVLRQSGIGSQHGDRVEQRGGLRDVVVHEFVDEVREIRKPLAGGGLRMSPLRAASTTCDATLAMARGRPLSKARVTSIR